MLPARASGEPIAVDCIPWCELDFDALNAIRAGLAERYSPATANVTLSQLRGLYKTAYVLGKVSERTWVAVRGLKAVRGSRVRRGRALSFDDERKLLAEAAKLPGYASTMFSCIIKLAIGGGLRREEVCKLALSAHERDVLHVLGKGNAERLVEVDEAMRESLTAWLAKRAEINPAHVGMFCSPQKPNRLLGVLSFNVVVTALAKRAGVVCTGPHDFRRTFATRLLDSGFDLAEVQRLMGHASVNTTARYDHRDEAKLRARRQATSLLAATAQTPAVVSPPLPPPNVDIDARAVLGVDSKTTADNVAAVEGFRRGVGESICTACGKRYDAHPMDPRRVTALGKPWLHVLCNGQRVKLK